MPGHPEWAGIVKTQSKWHTLSLDRSAAASERGRFSRHHPCYSTPRGGGQGEESDEFPTLELREG